MLFWKWFLGLRILRVCRGNIDRSPMARSVLVVRLAERGCHQISHQRARPVVAEDFERADLIMAMDLDNLDSLRKRCPLGHLHPLHLFLSWLPKPGIDAVADLYWGHAEGFERVLDLSEQGAYAWLDHLQTAWLQQPLVTRADRGGDQVR